jgi:hypothetical protein
MEGTAAALLEDLLLLEGVGILSLLDLEEKRERKDMLDEEEKGGGKGRGTAGRTRTSVGRRASERTSERVFARGKKGKEGRRKDPLVGRAEEQRQHLRVTGRTLPAVLRSLLTLFPLSPGSPTAVVD